MAYYNPYKKRTVQHVKYRSPYEKTEAQKRAEARAKAEEKTEDTSGVLARSVATAGDVAANVYTGALKGVEGILDFGVGLIGGIGGLFNEDIKEGTKEFVQFDIAGKALGGDYLQELTKYSYTNDSKVGEVIENIANGVGQMLPTVAAAIATSGASLGADAAKMAGTTAVQTAAKAAGRVAMATASAAAAGNATESALNDDADLYQALAYGGTMGAVEGATEKLLGGVDVKTVAKLGKGVAKEAGEEVAKQGGKRIFKEMLEEGAEEAISELVDPAARTIYQGGDALNDYLTADYWQGVGEAALVGGLTAAAYSGTVGHAIHKAKGTNADMDASFEVVENLHKQQEQIFAEYKPNEMSDTELKIYGKQFADIQSNIKLNMQNVEQTLKKASPEKRAKLIEKYEIDSMFDEDGSMKADYSEMFDKRIEAGKAGKISPYVSPDYAADEDTLNADLDALNADYEKSEQNEIDKQTAVQYNKTRAFKFQHQNFPSESETQSEAHRLAVWWARRAETGTGDQALISMNDSWYLVEKFDDADNGYQVERFVPKSEYNVIFKEIKKNGYFGSIKSVLETPTEYDKRNRSSGSIEGRESSADSSEPQHRRKSDEILRLDQGEADRGERPSSDGRGDSESSGAYQQRDTLKYSKEKRVTEQEKRTRLQLPFGDSHDNSKENVSQVNPQLYERLAIVNDKSSNDSISYSNGNVNTKSENNSLRYDYSKAFSEQDSSLKNRLYDNAKEIVGMRNVSNLTGEEFSSDGKSSLKDRVITFFNSFKNSVQSKELGKVAVTLSSFRDNKGHGLTYNKVVSFAAIPDVIKNGRVIDVWQPDGKPYQRITLAAPISISGEKYYMGVMVQKDNQSQRMYLHDVITEKATLSFTTEPTAKNGEGIRDKSHLFITSILQEALNVNRFSENNSVSTEGQQRRVKIFDGELSEKGKENFRDLKRAAKNLNALSGDKFNIALVNDDVNFKGVTVRGKNIYVNAEYVENGEWAGTLVHELTHFTEGSSEYKNFMSYLLSDEKNAVRKMNELTADGNPYGFTRENVERITANTVNTGEGKNTIRYSRMNDKPFADNVKKIEQMSDEEAQQNATEANFISVMKQTPETLLKYVEGAENLEIIIRFDALYLATRSDGCLKGHYHNLGTDIVLNLPQLISNPDAIIRLENGRINVLSNLSNVGKKNGVISIELNTVKDINAKNQKYNLVVSAFSTKDNYLKNIISKAVAIEYKKEDISQVNPQLYEWLATINDKSSNNSISQNIENVNTGYENNSLRDTKQEADDKEPALQYSKDSVIDLSDNNDLSKLVDGIYGSERYKRIADYIYNALGNREVELSDGRVAIVDKRDASHIAHKSGVERTAQISKIKEIVEKATLYAEDKNVKHDKFNYFCYYKATVRYGNETFSLYLNVGKGINDGKYHIYDITKKIRDTADRINGLERPKPNEGYALENDISNNSISQNTENVNTDSENNSLRDSDIEFMSEMVAGLAEDSVGTDGVFIDKLVRGNDTLTAKILNKIGDMTAALASRKTPEAREQYKRLKHTEKLFLNALKATGKSYRNGKIIGAAEEEEESRKLQYSIVNMDNGMQYVEATENQVIRGNDTKKWAQQVANYINNVIRNGNDLKIKTTQGDYLTITRDTAYKAGSRNNIRNPDGSYRSMTDQEYRVKLNAEIHINELAETSIKGNKQNSPDYKHHRFAKDGFTYRTAYFKDFDGRYYRLTISVGENGDISTVYNVGKLKEDTLPSGNIVSTFSGSKANNVSSANSIPDVKEKVNTKLQYSKKSNGQAAKNEANANSPKVYTKQDARNVMSTIVSEHLSMEDGTFGKLVGKSREAAIESLWLDFNKAGVSDRVKQAYKLADFILQNATLESMEISPQTEIAMERVSVLKDYMHKFDLSAIREEIKHKYDKDIGRVSLLWGKREGGISPDSIVDELAERGIIISSEHPAEILFEIDELYRKSREAIRKDGDMHFNEVLTEQEYKEIRQNIVKEIAVAHSNKGKPSTLATVSNNYEKIIKRLTGEIKEIKSEKGQRDRISYLINQIADLKKGAYIKASEYQSHTFKEGFENIVKVHWRGTVRDDVKVRGELKKIYNWYTSSENRLFHQEDGKPTADYRSDISSILEVLSDTNKKQFSAQELKMLEHVVTFIKHGIEHHNKIWNGEKWIDSKDRATVYLRDMKKTKEFHGTVFYKIFLGKYGRAYFDNATVFRAADAYNENGFFTEQYEAFRKAAIAVEYKRMTMFAEMNKFLDAKENKGYIKRLTEEKVEYMGEEITVGQLISLYMTSKRKQAWAALCKSGVALWNEKGDEIPIRRLADAPEKINTKEQMAGYIKQMQSLIESKLTEQDRKYIELSENIYKECSKMKEETDRLRLGISNVIQDYYYPIKRYDTAKRVDDDFFMEVDRATNMPFNHQTVKSLARIFVEPAHTVLERHSKGVIMYSEFAIPVENLNRLLNVDVGENHFDSETIFAQIKKSEDQRKTLDALTKLKNDIEGMKAKSDSNVKEVFGWVRGTYAKSVLAMNPKVLATQYSSLLAATSMLDYGCIAGGYTVKGIFEELDRYCSLAELRNWDNTAVKAQTLTDKTGKIADVLMTPIGKTDRLVVAGLFGACQLQVQKNGGAKVGTVENKTEAGKLLERVILETQQNSILTERSAAMRSDSEIIKSLVMFSADAMKVFSRVVDSYGELAVLRRKAKLFKDAPNKNAAEIAKLQEERAKLTAELEKSRKAVDEKVSSKDHTDNKQTQNYKKRIDAWDGKTEGFSFVIGDVPEYLSEIEVDDNKIGQRQIRIDATKIKKIMTEHPEMTREVIKKIPDIINAPILVLDSKTVGGRLVVFGEVYSNGKPVMVVLEINPTTRSGKSTYADVIKVASAYTRSNTQNLINNSNIRFVSKNKSRVNDWLKVNRLQLPLPNAQSNSATDSISQTAQKVNSDAENNFAELEQRMSELNARLEYLKNEPKNVEKQLKAARKKFGRSFSALVSSSIFLALVTLGFKWLYAKLKDEEPEDVAKDTAFDFIGNMMGGLPIYKDVYGFFTDGFEVDVLQMSVFNDCLKACESAVNLAQEGFGGGEITFEKTMATVKRVGFTAGMLFGIPVRNTYNLTSGLLNRFAPSSGKKLDAFWGAKVYSSDLKKAIENGDEKLIATISGLMTDESLGSQSKTVRGAVSELVGEGYDVLPRSLGDTVSYNGQQIELTASQKKRFRKIYDISDKSVEELVSLSQFSQAESSVRAKAIQFIYDVYWQIAVSDLFGTDEANKNVLFAEAIDIEKLALIISTARTFEADKDKNGKPISGTKKEKVLNYIESLNMSAAEKFIVAGFLGYRNLKGREKVEAYISKLGLTSSEKSRLLEYSGYSAA